MYRQIIGYVPSNVIPAIVSIAMVYAYTRLLSPAAFGSYSYVFSAVLVLQTSLFYALPIAVMRFYPAAARDDRREGLLREAYFLFYGMCFAVVVIGICVWLLIPLPKDYRLAAFLALPMLVFRSLVQLNQSVNRSANLMRRYNTVECVHAVLGFGLGLPALFVLGCGPEAIILGLLSAAVLCSAFDIRLLGSPFRRTARTLDRAELVRLVEYAWPLVGVAATAVILQNSDRFLLGSLAGTGALGIYAVAYNLVERPTTLICASISTATFPLVVQVLENQGREAARLQAGRNGIALLAVTLPACVGLALTADYIAAALVGPDFRSGVAVTVANYELYSPGPRGALAFYRPRIPFVRPAFVNALDLRTSDHNKHRFEHLRRAPVWDDGRRLDGVLLPNCHRGSRLVPWNVPVSRVAADPAGVHLWCGDRADGPRADPDPFSAKLGRSVGDDCTWEQRVCCQRARPGSRWGAVDRHCPPCASGSVPRCRH